MPPGRDDLSGSELELTPSFLAAELRGEEGWSELVDEVHPGVHRFPFLSPAWCRAFCDDVEHRSSRHNASGHPSERPNGLHEYGVLLSQLGYGTLLDEMMRRLRPLTASLFPDLGGGALDAHHGFLVEYAEDRDESLPFHVDDSEVTLNLHLNGEAQGAELYFRGVRCERHRQSPARRDEWFEYEPAPGVAILHAGNHRHGVEPLFRGRRRNLILWLRSTSFRGARARRRCGDPLCATDPA